MCAVEKKMLKNLVVCTIVCMDQCMVYFSICSEDMTTISIC